ncbi:glycosyltransferase [Ornithinimicrobium avium]|uniref:D-inositol 3-phosphate glycosyltransferase n=1 Tax=Ornithinimicrobium avium TaxID=2283195 RepID=A0A345NJZ0_9MICO|nr:glycosyltransferase [Ornithinimicrobium avium]AXH95348.1 glycosyltransferase [Ornithinimicrobium avium]
MRVLVVTTWFPTSTSPATGVFVARDVAAIATRHDVRVLHLCAPALLGQDEHGQGYAVERLPMDPRRPDHVLRAARRVRELAPEADLVHTMAVSALLPMTGRRPGVPWVHTEHWSGLLAPGTLTPALRAARPGVLRLLRRPDVVAVVSEHLAEGVRAARTGPVVVVPNIVDRPEELVARRDTERPLRDGREDGTGPGTTREGPLRVVSVGGLAPRKDPLAATRAVAALRVRGVDASLTWVGDGPLREEVREAARRAGVPLRLTGPVPPEQVQQIVGESDLFLLPTRAETFCVAAAEALAAGRPVVVGDSGGPRDFVAPPSGLLVRPGSAPGSWADAVEQVWAASAQLSAEEIAAPVVEAYSEQAHAARVDEIYRGVLPQGSPLVDVVVATHSLERPVDRAVRSVLDGSDELDVRVTVVCHGLDADAVAATVSDETRWDPRVRLLEHRDGVASPAGPFTAGLQAATAPWVSIMGSDDRLSPGALRNWLATAGRTGAEVVLAEIRLGDAAVPTPPTRVRPARRPRREERLDLVRDRLSYRSAPLGLLSRAAVARTGARLLPGAQTGEDVPFVTRLFEGASVALARGTPYLVGTDADDRTTAVPRPVADELVALTALLDDPWFAQLPARRRRAVATKLLRIHVFGTVLNRPDPHWWSAEERAELAGTTGRLLRTAPGCEAPLSLADHDLLAAVLDTSVPPARMIELATARRRHGSPRTLLPHDWRQLLHPEAPLRFMTASLVARRAGRGRSCAPE